MASEVNFELAHVLFMDVVGYSQLLIDDQHAILHELNAVVRETEQFRSAEQQGKLICVPTGDGMVLVFFTSPDAPARCAIEIARNLRDHPEIKLRMGIHCGPVSTIADVNKHFNVAGGGVNMAQRVMDCGDAGHILLSQRVAEDLAQFREWSASVHDLGEAEVKHGTEIYLSNFYGDGFGNSAVPTRLSRQWRTSVSRKLKRLLPIVSGLVAGVAIIIALLLLRPFQPRERTKEQTSNAIPAKSIAVLPLENLSRDPENAYFSDGIQEEILARLAKIADLKVISRTSTQSYKSRPGNLREIAKQLGVANVLEGSVQRAGDEVRITVQLINALTDSHLWAESYDRKFLDIFQVESDVAQKVADSLQAKLTGRERSEIAAGGGTKNPQAYDAYLRALALSKEQALEDRGKFLEFSRQAVKLDPNYAQAWAILAEAEAVRYLFPETNDSQLERARVAAETALRLAPDLPEAHAAMGAFYYYCLQEYDRALSELRTARERAPNDAKVWLYIAIVQRRQGKLAESIDTHRRAAELDPLNQDIWVNLARCFRSIHDFNQALATFDRALSVKPNDATILTEKAETYLAAGDLPAAQQILAALPFSWPETVPRSHIALLIFQRQFDEALRLVAVPAKGKSPFFVAVAHSLLGTLYSF